MGNEFRAWVLRANLTGFRAGCKLLLSDVPNFGDLVKVQVHAGFVIFGLIYDVTIGDDLVMRQLILADALEPEMIMDQRENRLAPIELSVLSVGYLLDGKIIHHGVPLQPASNLDSMVVCHEAELRVFTDNLAYLGLLLNTPQMPVDELLVVMLRRAAAVRPPEERYQFLVTAGLELARMLRSDLERLERILKRIRPS